MSDGFKPRNGWGPKQARAALCVTFDNFGEAAELEMGVWGDRPVGKHYTADFLPRLIDVLDGSPATYFVEASNAAMYSGHLRRWRDAGNEIGVHAWRHEVWAACPPARRREILARSMAAMRAIGIEPTGFRPPGGAIGAEAWVEIKQAGLLYCSSVGSCGPARVGGMVSVPFAWQAVDSYMIEDFLGGLRVANGDPEQAPGLDGWRRAVLASLDDAVAEGAQRTIIFHPMFLAHSPDKLSVVEDLLAAARSRDIWVARMGDLARFVADETSMAHA